DWSDVLVPMRAFADEVARHLGIERDAEPMIADVAIVADRMARIRPVVMWGEPTVRVPADHGEGGRAQQLALELAKRVPARMCNAFVVASDGCDGPPPRDRPAPAGAFVTSTTWREITRAGIDPQRALDRCDA